jgi:hypothetical protein
MSGRIAGFFRGTEMPDAGRAAVSVIDDLQQVAPLLSSERRDAPIVRDQHLHARARLLSVRV